VELPKRTKIAGGVLVLALAGLGYDRFAASPESASAAVEPAGNTNSPEASAKAGVPVPNPVANAAPSEALVQPTGALADRLSQLRLALPKDSARDDAFKAPPEWFPAPVRKPITEAPKVREEKPAFKLTSVFTIGQGELAPKVAVIDNKFKLMVGAEPGTKAPYPSEMQIKNTDGSLSTLRLVSADFKAGSAMIEIDGQQMELVLEARAKSQRADEPASK
jgi:hypothetical protein